MKLKNRRSTPALTALLIAAFSVHGAEKFVWTDGHGDLAVNYANGRWIWYAAEGHQVDQVIVRLNEVTRTQIPDLPAFSFLGKAGDPIWIIPAGEKAGIPFMGINSEAATRSGTFVNDRFNLHLNRVNGPGDFFMWTTSGTGAPTILMNSRDGITSADTTDVPAPGHFHQNWGFTSPGTYRIGYKASGVLTGQTTPITSDEVVYTFEANVLKQGEADIEVAFEDGKLELRVHDEAADMEFDPAHLALQAGPATWQTVPESAAFAFLGQPGASLYVLPQKEQEGVLFLGLAAAEVEQGIFANNRIAINLASVSGPGHVFYYEVDGFGAPAVFFNSANGVDAADAVTVNAGAHAHRNWGFTAPGVYRVTLQAKGALAAGGEVKSDPATFLFEVLPPAFIDRGEVDLEIAFEQGAFELGLHEVATGIARSPDETVLIARAASRSTVPPKSQFSFLGAPGSTVYILPQDETEGLLFIGIAGDEIEAGLLTGESVRLELVSATGPGDFALYAVDTFSKPTVFMNTRDGISAADVFPVAVGSHAHVNWAFSQAGEYRVQFRAAGTLVAGNRNVLSEPVTLAFRIEAVGPRLTAQLVNNGRQLQIGWPSRSGVSYQLRSRMALDTGGWSNEGARITGNGAQQTVTIERGNELLKVFQILEVQP
jgi:surface-anchored protein